MTSLHLVFDEPAQWYFYVIILIFVSAIIYSGFLSIEAILALLGLRPLRKMARQASVLTTPISTIVWFKAISRIGFCIFVICGIWVAINANFRCFRTLDVVADSIHLSYNLHTMDRDVSMPDIRSMVLEHVRRRDPKHPYFELEITTIGGKVFRSIMTHDEAVITNCQQVIDSFNKRATNNR